MTKKPRASAPSSPSASASASSPYRAFTAAEWGELRGNAELTLSESELAALRGAGETVSLREVEQIYLPLSRLLNHYVAAVQQLHAVTSGFLGREGKVPFIIGVAGSVAVGKSTTSRILQQLLARWDNTPRVALVTTDGFLFPNRVLEARHILQRKGFPESFDLSALHKFLARVKSGAARVTAPVYSHISYDIVPDEHIEVRCPDILIVEGLNVLQPGRASPEGEALSFVSDYFDFTIYIDAEAEVIQNLYVERFMSLRRTAFMQPGAYFRRYADLDDAEARATAIDIWTHINLANLRQNILPTRGRADLILHKAADHAIDGVRLRKI